MDKDNEINDLLDGYLPPVENNEEPPASDTPTPEPPAEPPPPSEEPPPVESLPPSSPQEDLNNEQPTPPAEPPPVAPPSEDPRDTRIKQLEETISALQQTVESVSKQATQAPVAPAPAAPEAKLTFLEKEEDLDKALNSVDNFNSLLASVVSKAEEIIAAKAELIAAGVAHQVFSQRTAVNEFYQANSDLAANKAFVGVVANELAAAHPEWDMIKIIENLGGEVRGRLKLAGVAPAQPPIDAPTETPAFVPGNSSRTSVAGTAETKLQKEVNDLIADLV